MFLDDDTPPELVEAVVGPQEEELTVKVPITIVTGMMYSPFSSCRGLISWLAAHRISRRWQDHAAQLHPDGTTRQEDCRHHERSGRHRACPVHVLLTDACHQSLETVSAPRCITREGRYLTRPQRWTLKSR